MSNIRWFIGFISVILAVSSVSAASNNWSGANSYFLWTLADWDRAAHLSALRDNNVTVIRIFITAVGSGTKGSSSGTYPDVEAQGVGRYTNAPLDQINKLMAECRNYGLKLNIVFHDRYALGWDAYKNQYGSPENFYNNAGADFDRRIQYILKYPNPNFGGRAWGDLHEVVWGFGIQNEARGHMESYNAGWNWHCARANAARPLTHSKIYITTGGGATWADSLQEGNFQCKNLDVIGIHSYDGPWNLESNMNKAIQLANKYQKSLIYEEFGKEGDSAQSSDISSQGATCNRLGIPWFPWQFIRANGGSYEYYTGSQSWKSHASAARAATQVRSLFDWNNFDAGSTTTTTSGSSTTGGSSGTTGGGSSGGGTSGGGSKGDWVYCTDSTECSNGCCSKEYSNDGQLKCTPGGHQCVQKQQQPKLNDWVYCSSSSQCINNCCSNEYSNDGQNKCTPGGHRCI